MANFKTALAMENEIFKATDFNFGYDSIISNIATAMKTVLSGSDGNYVIGGKVTPYGSGGLNVSIAPIYGFCNSTGVCVAEGDTTEPVSFEEADGGLDRIDIIEIRGAETGYDSQSRKFIDPSTATETTQTVNTKKRIALEVKVKRGSNGSEAAPAVDGGYVKLAEVRIPAGTNNITGGLIRNIDARKCGVNNTGWTTDKAATFNPSYLADVFHTLLVQHNEDGSHKGAVVKAANIDFGTDSAQVKGSVIPSGQSMSVHGADFTSGESLTRLIQSLAGNANNLYKYANDIFSRFSFLADLPAACSTENVDIAAGGEMQIDGVSVSIGQLVLLKDQADKKENGFYEVQSGAWNRYAGYTTADANAFIHKLILVPAGTANKGKVFYINGDFERIGADELVFIESRLSPYARPLAAAVRDKDGRAKFAEPKDADDAARKKEIDDIVSGAVTLKKLTVEGDITQRGGRYVTRAEDVRTKNDMIHLRDGARMALGEGELSGVTAELYDGAKSGALAFDRTGTARVGDEGSEQPLATRMEAAEMTDGAPVVWSARAQRLETRGAAVVEATTDLPSDGPVSADRTIVVRAESPATVSLGDGAYPGVEVMIINATDAEHKVRGSTARGADSALLARQVQTVVWNGRAWEGLSCPRVGETYTQLPNQSSPQDLFICTKWEEVDYGGAFFRAAGGGALAFNGGLQPGSVGRHTHTGTLRYGVPGSVGITVDYGADVTQAGGGETRPANYTVRVWRRTAYGLRKARRRAILERRSVSQKGCWARGRVARGDGGLFAS